MNINSSCPTCGFNRLPATSDKIVLNGIEFSLFKDYVDKGALAGLSFDDKLRYLKARAMLVFLEPIDEIFGLEKSGHLAKYHLLDLVTIICCAIEGLGHYLKGTDESGPSFKLFIEEFMKTLLTIQSGKPISDYLWEDYRNGLAHGFCIKNGGIERGGSWYFKPDPKIGLQINIDSLILDFKQSFEKFFDRLQVEGENGTFGEAFKKRFKEIFLN
jgi:hypothetical protein